MEARYVNDSAVAAHLGLHVSTIRKDRLEERRIPYVKLGGRVLYNLEAVDAAVDALTIGGGAPKPNKAKR